jgi:phage antirepressor YoqD-like protein
MDDEQMIYVNFTETTEYSVELEFAEMAKVLGIGKVRLAEILRNGEDLEPSDAAVARLRKRAEITDGQVEIDDFGEA